MGLLSFHKKFAHKEIKKNLFIKIKLQPKNVACMNLFRSEFFLSNPIPYPLDSRRKTSQQDSKISGDGGQFKVGNEVFRLSG